VNIFLCLQYFKGYLVLLFHKANGAWALQRVKMDVPTPSLSLFYQSLRNK